MYYTYMLRCKDNSIYTGYASDLEKRMEKHFSKAKVAAKYTKSHEPIKLEAAWQTRDKSLACSLEYNIKTLTKKQKEKLIDGEKLTTFFKGKIDSRRFRRVKGM